MKSHLNLTAAKSAYGNPVRSNGTNSKLAFGSGNPFAASTGGNTQLAAMSAIQPAYSATGGAGRNIGPMTVNKFGGKDTANTIAFA